MPESERASSTLEPLVEVTCTLSKGAISSAEAFWMLEIKCFTVGVLAGVCVAMVWGLHLVPLLQQTLAKWLTFWHQKHAWLYAGH